MVKYLDFKNINTKDQLFDYINKVFQFDNYCTNLDALYDELTSITFELNIVIKNIELLLSQIGNYGNILKQVFVDCEEECENIHIIYE